MHFDFPQKLVDIKTDFETIPILVKEIRKINRVKKIIARSLTPCYSCPTVFLPPKNEVSNVQTDQK
jgi:hypothetical protein